MDQIRENTIPKEGGARVKKRSKKPLLVMVGLLAVLAGAYLGLCAYAVSRPEIWSDTVVLGQDLGGLTAEEAATLEALRCGDPARGIASLRLEQERIEWDWVCGRILQAASTLESGS